MNSSLTPSLQEQQKMLLKIREVLQSPPDYCRRLLKIRNKRGEVVALDFNFVQQRVYNRILEARNLGKPIRLIILKARQQGISTQTEGLIFHDTVTKKNRSSLIMAHDPDSTRNIFEMNKFFYEELPEGLRPMKRYDNTSRLVFDNPDEKLRDKNPGMRSQITIATANKQAVGRGITIQNFHGSEVGFWLNAKEIMLAVSQAVPDHEDTMMILESTANGVGGYFYDMYWNAKNKKNDYTAIFLPWFEFPDYARPVEPGTVWEQDELDLQKMYRLTDTQLSWRRWCIANKCDGDPVKFQQEYPSNDMEAFIVSGTPKFNNLHLKKYLDNRKAPLWTGNLTSENTPENVKEPKLQEDSHGHLKIYSYPNYRHSYVIGGDVGKGTETSDFSSLHVIDRHNGDVVAVLYGKINPTDLAYEAARLGYFYKGGQEGALIGIEVNKSGVTTNSVLYHEIGYKRVYKRRNLDNIHKTAQESLGFHTNERSRALIIDKLQSWIQEGEFSLHDEITIMQCMTFVILDGKAQAQEGCFDDAVMSLAIAIFLFDYNVEVKEEPTELERNIKILQQKTNQPKW